MLLGTVGYMAPEQVRGEPVDPRTDIFALGIVIYEMLVGTAPFQRDTSAETLTAILKDDPPGQPTSVPPALDRLLRRCLEKRPDDRVHSAHDLSLALEALSSGSGRVARVSEPQPASGVSRRQILAGGVGLGLLGVGLGAGAFVWGRARPAPMPSYHRLTFRRGMIRTARFAPDYRTILYGALWGGDVCRIHTVRRDSPESAPLNLPPATPLSVSSSAELVLALGTHLRGIMTYGTLGARSARGRRAPGNARGGQVRRLVPGRQGSGRRPACRRPGATRVPDRQSGGRTRHPRRRIQLPARLTPR